LQNGHDLLIFGFCRFIFQRKTDELSPQAVDQGEGPIHHGLWSWSGDIGHWATGARSNRRSDSSELAERCRGGRAVFGGLILVVAGEQEAAGRWLASGGDSRYDNVDARAREWGRGGTEETGSLGIVVGVLQRLL
jgi:hypothetical protein